MNEFGRYIRNLRDSKELSLRKLAEISGLSHSTIASLERGEVTVKKSHISALSKALGADEDAMLIMAGFYPDKAAVEEEGVSDALEYLSNFDLIKAKSTLYHNILPVLGNIRDLIEKSQLIDAIEVMKHFYEELNEDEKVAFQMVDATVTQVSALTEHLAGLYRKARRDGEVT